jgi:hypothetical protein
VWFLSGFPLKRVAANKEATEARVSSWSHHFESFTVATMTWLAVMEYLCQKWPRIFSTCRKHFLFISSFMAYHRACN